MRPTMPAIDSAVVFSAAAICPTSSALSTWTRAVEVALGDPAQGVHAAAQ